MTTSMERDLFYFDGRQESDHLQAEPTARPEPTRDHSDQTVLAKETTEYGVTGQEEAEQQRYSHDWPFRDRYLMERHGGRTLPDAAATSYGSQDDYGVPYEIYNQAGEAIWSSYPSDDETGSLDWDSSFDPFTSSTFRRGSIVLDSAAPTPSLAPSPSSPAAVKLRSSTDALREFGKKFLSRASKHSSRKQSKDETGSASGERVMGHRSRHSGGSSTTNTNPSVGRTRSNTVDSMASRLSLSGPTTTIAGPSLVANAMHPSPAHMHIQNALGLSLSLPLAEDEDDLDPAPIVAPATVLATDLTPSSPGLASPLQQQHQFQQQQQHATEGYFVEHSPSLLPSLIRDEIFPDSPLPHTEAMLATPSLPSPSLETLEDMQYQQAAVPAIPSATPLSPAGLSIYHAEGEPGLAALMEQMQQEDAAFEATERSMTTSGWSSEAEINELRRRRRENQSEWQAKVESVLDAESETETVAAVPVQEMAGPNQQQQTMPLADVQREALVPLEEPQPLGEVVEEEEEEDSLQGEGQAF